MPSVFQPRRRTTPKVPNADLARQIDGLCALSTILSETAKKAKVVCEDYLEDWNPRERRLPAEAEVASDILALDDTIRIRGTDWKDFTGGADALCACLRQETLPERRRMLAEAQLELCCFKFLGIAEIALLGRQILELWGRPIEAEIIRREMSVIEGNLRQQVVTLLKEYPSIKPAAKDIGIEVEMTSEEALQILRVGFANVLEGFAVVLMLLWFVSLVRSVVSTWPYMGITCLVHAVVFVVLAPAGDFLLNRADIMRKPRMTQHTQSSQSETHECGICSSDLFDFAPDDPDSTEQPRDQTTPASFGTTRSWPEPICCVRCKNYLHASCLFRWLTENAGTRGCPFCRVVLPPDFPHVVLKPLVDKHRAQKRLLRK